jgi:hypothetical protein
VELIERIDDAPALVAAVVHAVGNADDFEALAIVTVEQIGDQI